MTERKQIEDALRKSEERLRSMADAVQDAIIVMDCDGRTTFWNRAAEKIFGYSRSEIMGRNIGNMILPEKYREDYYAGIRRFREAGTEAAVGQTLEITVQHKDGTVFPVEMSLSAMQLSSEWHAISIVRDVSERVKRNEAHAWEISQYMAMINSVPAMTFLKDINQHFLIANDSFCDIVGKPLNEIVGKTAGDLFDPDEAASQLELERQAIEEHRIVVNQEERRIRGSGEERWTSTTIVPVHDKKGRVTGVVGLIQDVTELHLSREKLVQADKMAAIGTLAAGVAHEINNPVGFISSNLNVMGKYVGKIRKYLDQLTQADVETREELTEILDDFADAVDESLEGADRVKKIVADLKSFSRVDKSQKGHYNLNEGLETTLNIVWNELKYKCTVEKNYGDIPDLYCIPNQLNQVFMNLLVNAGQAIQSDSGRLTISTLADEQNIYVSISDTGVGIAHENLKRIFEPFYTTKEIGKGTGLDLSVAYDIVEKHVGRIDVKSEVGRGTEFLVTLPLEGIKRGETENTAG